MSLLSKELTTLWEGHINKFYWEVDKEDKPGVSDVARYGNYQPYTGPKWT